MHFRACAVDRGVSATTFNHESKCRRDVPMAGSDLPRHHQLDPGIEALSDLRHAADSRILENKDTALGLPCGDQAPGFHEQRTDLAIPPERGLAFGLRLRRYQIGKNVPERSGVFPIQTFVEFLTLRTNL